MTATWSDTTVTWSSTSTTWAGAYANPAFRGVIEAAFGDLPSSSSRTWTDITAYARAASGHRGRNTELDRIEAGTATILLSNRDQRFDPNNTAGPYYGNLRPMTPIRVRAYVNGQYYPVWSGLVRSWPQEYPETGRDAVAPVECVDLLGALNLNPLTASYGSQLSGARIDAVLTSAGWPTGSTFRDVDTGQSTVQASTLTAASALAHIQDVVRSESGVFFVSRAGKATFIDRHTLLLTTLDTGLTWSDAGGYPYMGLGFLDSEVALWNSITVTADALTTQTATDSTSVNRYFTRGLTADTLLTTTNDMDDLAEYLLTRYKEPATRVARLDVTGMTNPTTIWPAILNREIADKIRVERSPTAAGDTIVQDSVIEAIDFQMVPGMASFTFALSPMENSADYWILDDAVQSILDSTTRLAY